MRRFISIICFFIGTHGAYADDITQVLNAIEKNNITLKALALEQEANIFDRKAENTIGGPTIEYSPFYRSGYKGVASSELIVSEEIKFPSLYAKQRRQTELVGMMQDNEYAAKRREILTEALLTCLDLVRINQFGQLLERRSRQTETVMKMLEKKLSAGDATALEMNKAKMENMETLQQLAGINAERQQMLAHLCQLNGGTNIVMNDTVFPSFTLPTDFDSFMQQSLAKDPDINLLHSSLRVMEKDVELNKNSWLPNLTMGYRRNTDEGINLNGFMVGASFPLFSTTSRIKASKQRQQSVQLSLDEKRKGREAEMKSQYQQLLYMQNVLEHTDVELLGQTLVLLDKALQHGQIPALQYYSEVGDIYNKLQNHISLHCEYTKLMALFNR